MQDVSRFPYRAVISKVFLLVWLSIAVFGVSASAAQLTLAWSPNTEPNLGGYNVYYGEVGQGFTQTVDVGNPFDPVASEVRHTVTGLEDGRSYRFAVTAYDSTKALESGYSNEVSKTFAFPAPVADFSASPTSGLAPLTVNFNDTSSGNITDWSWSFGDGGTSAGDIALYTYQNPGTYTVSLTVTGPGGSDTRTMGGYITVNAATSGGGGSGSGDTGNGGGTDTSGGSNTGGGTNAGGDPGVGGNDVAGLVAAYGFEEVADIQAVDSSGTGNDGAISGATRISEGRFGQALSFDGVDDWVTVNDSDALDLGAGMTLEAWVYPTALSGWNTVLLKEQPGNAAYYLYANTDNNQPVMSINATPDFDGLQRLYGDFQLPAGTWSHLAATYDGAQQRLYIDGNEVASRPLSQEIWASDGVLRIGGNSVWSEYFEGYLDEIRIYNRALTASEIQADMTQPVVEKTTSGEALVEAGEVQVDHNWKQVTFNKTFVDPVVVAKPLSDIESEPALVRIRNVGSQGFELHLQEWDYQDGVHAAETVGYLVMERGHHTLADGTQVEAGRLAPDSVDMKGAVSFAESFATMPVVMAAVTSVNEPDAVVSRIRRVSDSGFAYRLQEQEANLKSHAGETFSYIAWEPSVGVVDGLEFEIGRTGDVVRHKLYTVTYQSVFGAIPVFLADMQTTDGGDTSNLRWQNKGLDQIEVRVSEEQSRDDELRHTSEIVGYMLFMPID